MTVSLGRFSLKYRITFQSANPVQCPFWSLCLPCTVKILAPALRIIFAYSSVFSLVSSTRIFAVTGTSKFRCSLLINL